MLLKKIERMIVGAYSCLSACWFFNYQSGRQEVAQINKWNTGLNNGPASFIVSLITFIQFNGQPVTIDLFDWISSGSLSIPFSFMIDQLSLIMLLIITGVGFLIHVYSIGYMHGDEGFSRFFSYLNLFIFFMLLLVMGSNYIVMFTGWEGVGLCSPLIGWFKNPEYNKAANKAFIMNRIGDLGFLLGIIPT